jgi:hypothetical protein
MKYKEEKVATMRNRTSLFWKLGYLTMFMLKRKKRKEKRGKRGEKGKNSEFSRRWIIFYANEH